MAKKKGRNRSSRTLTGLARVSADLLALRAPLYAETGDPLRAWEAYYLARAIPGHELPEWVTSYLDRVARQMIDVSRKEPTGAKLARAIAKALEMNGRGRVQVFARRKALRRAQQYAIDVDALIKGGSKQYLAIDHVAKFHGVSRSTVERAYQQTKARGAILFAGGWERWPVPSVNMKD